MKKVAVPVLNWLRKRYVMNTYGGVDVQSDFSWPRH
jgi:hypothetical protein